MAYNNKDAGIEYRNMRQIKAILGNQFIVKDIEMDLKEATDFTLLKFNPFTVGVRLRRYEYLKYSAQFTIRWSRPSGVATEFQKIMQELVDYILYGFVDREETKIIKYFIGDLEVFRQAAVDPVEIKPNNPPDSELAVYNKAQFPPTFILKEYPSEMV